MRRPGWLILLVASALGASAGGAACNMVLGDHEIVGEDRFCSDDSECDDDERCSEDTGGVCRERCNENGDPTQQCLQQGIDGWRECTDDGTCTEPIGTPCDAEEYDDAVYCGGYDNGMMCAGEDSDGEKVPGYCTVSCRESAPECPVGYVCGSIDGNSDRCVLCASGACAP